MRGRGGKREGKVGKEGRREKKKYKINVITVDPRLSEHLWSPNQFEPFEYSVICFQWEESKFYLMHTTNALNIVNLVVRIIEGSDK